MGYSKKSSPTLEWQACWLDHKIFPISSHPHLRISSFSHNKLVTYLIKCRDTFPFSSFMPSASIILSQQRKNHQLSFSLLSQQIWLEVRSTFYTHSNRKSRIKNFLCCLPRGLLPRHSFYPVHILTLYSGSGIQAKNSDYKHSTTRKMVPAPPCNFSPFK